MYIEQEDIYNATSGGLDIILRYYQQAESVVHGNAKNFKIRNERTASASIKKLANGLWIVTDFGDDQTGKNAIQVCMTEENMSFREALVFLAGEYNVAGLTPETHKPEFKKRKAKEDEKDGETLFDVKKEMTEKELKTLGAKVTQSVCQSYNVYALNSFSYVKNREVFEIHATENYPIFLFDYESDGFKKIYQPNAYEKANRFRYVGNKPKDYIFGLKQLIRKYNEFNRGREEDKPEEKLPEVIIGSGERDGLNIAGMCYIPVWLNSETGLLTEKQYHELSKYVDIIYVRHDIDNTGKKIAYRQGLNNLE